MARRHTLKLLDTTTFERRNAFERPAMLEI